MKPLITSQVLGRKISEHFQNLSSDERDCRLVIPGLTNKISFELHEYLHKQGILTYLVVGGQFKDKIDQEKGIILPIGLTSIRIGSFIAIIMPGQLVNIQDSIRGTGGTIRSQLFSEEWPWRNDGSEAFNFGKIILKDIIGEYTSEKAEQEWLYGLIWKGLIESTKSSPNRANILLENFLGEFNHEMPIELQGTILRFLFHAGLPCPSRFDSPCTNSNLPNVETFVKDTRKLSRSLVLRCQEDPMIREQVFQVIDEMEISDETANKIKQSVSILLDGFGSSTSLDLDLLAFSGSWGKSCVDPKSWLMLHQKLISDLFRLEVTERTEMICKVSPQRGIADSWKVASFHSPDDQITLTIDYNISDFNRDLHSYFLRVLNRTREVSFVEIFEKNGKNEITIPTIEIASNHSKRILLRVALYEDDVVKAHQRIEVHLCGTQRPSFVIIQPLFMVIDASKNNENDIIDNKIQINEPISLTLFGDKDDTVKVVNEFEKEVNTHKEADGIWQTSEKIDVAQSPFQKTDLTCFWNDSTAIICLEADNIEKGEFTVEDELRVIISDLSKRKLEDIFKLFEGTRHEPYYLLGGINKSSRLRIELAKYFLTENGMYPMLVDMLEVSNNQTFISHGMVNLYVNPDETVVPHATLPKDASLLLQEYKLKRDKLLTFINNNVKGGTKIKEHPLYCSNPIYIEKSAGEVESLISVYLDSYTKILTYIKQEQNHLERNQLFVLIYLDCVVHWDNTGLREGFYLLGPYHPLVIAKRFMVQSALFQKAKKYERGNVFNRLSVMLGHVQGFRWVQSLAMDDKKIEHSFVACTSDPGWHIALNPSCEFTAVKAGFGSLVEMLSRIQVNLGIEIRSNTNSSHGLAITSLKNYIKAYPSRRSIGIRVSKGYEGDEVIRNVDSFLHSIDSSTFEGSMLHGGVRLHFSESLPEFDAVLDDPPLTISIYEDDKNCIDDMHPDIFMLPANTNLSFSQTATKFALPRGEKSMAVFYEPIKWLTEGADHIPKSYVYEFDYPVFSEDKNLGYFFSKALLEISSSSIQPMGHISSVNLPVKLNAPWVIVPGQTIDPAILVKYVKDGSDRSLEDRVLWDYKFDLSGQKNSFFILSSIPKTFKIAVNGFFDRDVAGRFIGELGEIGIAIGGESIKSGRHAFGTIGLIGAVRLLIDETDTAEAAISQNMPNIGVLIPVDSFESFFGKNDISESRRADLLAINIFIPEDADESLIIKSCGIEAKFISGTYSNSLASAALEQAIATESFFKRLVLNSLEVGSIPERLTLIELIKFGLRIAMPRQSLSPDKWIMVEQKIYDKLLKGKYKYISANYKSILVSTEGSLPGAAEMLFLENGAWIRLTKTHWPGINETDSIKMIRQKLADVFTNSEDKNPLSNTEKVIDETVKNDKLTPINIKESESPIKPSEKVPKEKIDNNLGKEQINDKTDQQFRRIEVGADESRNILYFDPKSSTDPLDNLNIMISGSSGTGKTQLLKYLIMKFREQDKNTLILDFKNDFAADSIFCKKANLERIFVNFDGLPFNPLIPYPVRHPATNEFYVQCGQHISGITSILKQTYRLGDQQQYDVKEVISDTFESAGIRTTGNVKYDEVRNAAFPDFGKIGQVLSESNPKAYNRLDPLFTLGLFKDEFKNFAFDSLVNRSAVIDLSQIPSDEIKTAISQLIVLSAHSYYNSQQHSGKIKMMLVFDEAHRVVKSEFMLKLVRECRAYGVGVILSSQYPSDFPSEISSSMATKIMHGNGKESDRVKAIVQMLGCEGREEEIANLERFNAIIDNHHTPHTFLRTFNFPMYLVWLKLNVLKTASLDELSKIEGIDNSKLPITNIVQQFERMGLAETINGIVSVVKKST